MAKPFWLGLALLQFGMFFFFRIEVVKYPNTFLLEKKVEQGHFVCKLECMLNFVNDFYK
jgi:hypothetical protein